MLNLGNFLQQDWINSLGWTLLHSLWQHALIAFCCALLLFFNKQGSANTRYLTAFGSMVLAIFSSAVTFYQYQRASSAIVIGPLQTDSLIPLRYEAGAQNIIDIINTQIGSITLLWLAGVMVYGLKILWAYRSCQQLKDHFITATPHKWQDLFATLAAKVGVTANIELRISLVATIPCVIGHIKPVVLLPIKLLSGMNQLQIEAILLHELAHIRRQDYLLGLIQTLIKALFFFNPFLHWISSQIDKEREHACDDIAVSICQNPILFSNTLKELAEMNANQTIAMNITSNKFLLKRITRLFNRREKTTTARNNVVASLLILLTSLLVTICVNAAPENSSDKNISLEVTDTAVQEVLKEVNKKCGTRDVLVTKNNEKITLKLESISCEKAIQLLKDFAAEKPAL